jgi:hypothetical protein
MLLYFGLVSICSNVYLFNGGSFLRRSSGIINLIILNINYARSVILVPCLVYCFFKQSVDIFFYKSYYQESNILIIAYSSVVTVAEWLDGSFESQNRFWKAQQWFETRKPNNAVLLSDAFHIGLVIGPRPIHQTEDL